MKKIVMMMISATVLWSAQASADILTTETSTAVVIPEKKMATDGLTFTAQARLRFEDQARTSAFVGGSSFWSYRLRPNLAWNLSSGLQMVLEPQFAKRMGAETYVLGQAPTPATPALTETSGNTGYSGDPMTVYQAYFLIPLGEMVKVKAGRQALRYGADLILGPGNWGVYGRSFDAILVNGEMGGISVDLFQAKIADFGTKANQGDRDLNGIYLTWKPGAYVKTLEVYSIERVDLDNQKTGGGADTSASSRYAATGARLVSDFSSYGVALEYAKGSGSSNFVGDGSNAEIAALNLNTPSFGGHKFGFEYATSGENWNEIYPTTNKALGRADVLGRRNLIATSLSVKSDWSDKWSTELAVYDFQRSSNTNQIYGVNGTSAFGSTTSDAKAIGNEIDLVVSYQQNKNATWSVGAAKFSPGAYLNDTLDQAGQTDNREAHYAYAMLETQF